jgi:hypothetical protein
MGQGEEHLLSLGDYATRERQQCERRILSPRRLDFDSEPAHPDHQLASDWQPKPAESGKRNRYPNHRYLMSRLSLQVFCL